MILLDTNYIISFFINTENEHQRALEITKNIEGNELVITNAILIEVINLLTKKLNRNIESISNAHDFMNREFKIKNGLFVF